MKKIIQIAFLLIIAGSLFNFTPVNAQTVVPTETNLVTTPIVTAPASTSSGTLTPTKMAKLPTTGSVEIGLGIFAIAASVIFLAFLF
ncbi:MAG: hypothetical protein Q7R95_02080 [bacterium]|nr:hypothetical protein [bacterium]